MSRILESRDHQDMVVSAANRIADNELYTNVADAIVDWANNYGCAREEAMAVAFGAGLRDPKYVNGMLLAEMVADEYNARRAENDEPDELPRVWRLHTMVTGQEEYRNLLLFTMRVVELTSKGYRVKTETAADL